jgi:cellulose synthase/poly-beta-1,6-N-acetylglucosamine synthase-like glycosyltransferase
VKVGNRVNWLTKWQSIEYTTSQNFDRLAYANINAITVIPGAIGAFRRSVINEVGGYSSDTLAEDCDLTVRILKKVITSRMKTVQWL